MSVSPAETRSGSRPAPGFMVVHGNRMEELRALVIEWIRRHPLAPLDSEIILVQSNGVAQWLKLGLAAAANEGGLGICAATQTQLAQRFVWTAYRAVLGEETLPKNAPFDAEILVWRLLRIFHTLPDDPVFTPLRQYLSDDTDARKALQLSERIAALFQQYQLLRADWLADWGQGRDRMSFGRKGLLDVPQSQAWQPALWRLLRDDAPEAQSLSSRADAHQRFLEAVRDPGRVRPQRLPERVIVFGLSSIPAQSLEALAALGRWCEVLMCVLNPCQHDWSELISDHDLFQSARRRQSARPLSAVTALPSASVGHPLLAAWGRQGRDLIRLLDAHDDRESYAGRFSEIGSRIDLFDEPGGGSLLQQLQSDILEMRSPAESRERWPATDPVSDRSVSFHICHSPQREVEVLQDQLLAAFAADPSLKPRDILVMVPDISEYAPHIQSVFGRFGLEDPRHIAFSLTDRAPRASDPILLVLETLLRLPQSRLLASEVLDLLEVSAVRRRFGIEESDLPRLRHWLERSGIRWGLDAAHRQSLGIPDTEGSNTWEAGLKRMLLGYAVGDRPPWQAIAPMPISSALSAELIGPLDRLISTLSRCRSWMAQSLTPAVWCDRLRQMLDDFFLPVHSSEGVSLMGLRQRLAEWKEQTDVAAFDMPVPVQVISQVWLGDTDASPMGRPFIGGGVTFATLTPMRSVPFKLIALLGMNDESYPRAQPPADFDLIAHDPRPGDRSRREDDRYVFLETLLSARSRLLISWVGRSIVDNEPRPPSVLVAQLRDHLASCWRKAGDDSPESGKRLLAALTLEHRLQAFSPAYFTAGTDPRLFSYAAEWLDALKRRESADATTTGDSSSKPLPLPAAKKDLVITRLQMQRFLRSPADSFLRERLGIQFPNSNQPDIDEEPLVPDSLQLWGIRRDLIRLLGSESAPGRTTEQDERVLETGIETLLASGRMPPAPLSGLFAESLRADLLQLAALRTATLARWPHKLDDVRLDWLTRLADPGLDIRLFDYLEGLRADQSGSKARILIDPTKHRDEKNGKLKPHSLLVAWVDHLCAHLVGEPIRTCVIGFSGEVVLPPMDPTRAREDWDALVQAWAICQHRPIAVAPRTAFAWLAQKADDSKALAKARIEFEEDIPAQQKVSERSRDPALARLFPDFDHLQADGEFPLWVDRLYRPLVEELEKLDAASSEAPEGTQS